MKIQVGAAWSAEEPRLIYRPADYAFLSEPKPSGGITSVLMNDLQLEVDERGCVLYAWGMFPNFDVCEQTELEVPRCERRRINFIPEEEWIPGVSVRLNDIDLPIFANLRTGWVGVGEANTDGRSVSLEIVPGVVAVLADGRCQAIWLEPKIDKTI